MMAEPKEQQQVPLHVQQAQQIAARLQQDKAGSDSVTWVPELIPQFVQRAVEAVLTPTQDAGSEGADANDDAAATDNGTAAGSSTPTAPAPPVLSLASQHLRVTSSSSKRPVDWVMTACLVPEGLPTAAAAEEAGGLATMEVVCRLLMLQDCQPVEVSAAFIKALTKVKWQQYGLQYTDFFSCDDNTGILTLGVLPDATMVPLSLIVCSCNTIEHAPQGVLDPADADADAAAAADQTLTDPSTQAQTQAAAPTQGGKRRRGGSSRGPRKPAGLSARRELPLWVSALEGALSALKDQLPAGYMRGRHETLLAAALPPIAASLASIMARAANSQLRQESCHLLECEPAELEEVLLTQLQELAAEALALKMSTAGILQQQGDTQQPLDASAAAAALLAAGGGDGKEQQQEEEQQQGPGACGFAGGGADDTGPESHHHHHQQQQQGQEQPPLQDADAVHHHRNHQQQLLPRPLTVPVFTSGFDTQQQQQQLQQQSHFGGVASWEGQQEQQQQQQQVDEEQEQGMHPVRLAWQRNQTGSQQQQQQQQVHASPWHLLGPASWSQDCNAQREAPQHGFGSMAAAAGGGAGGDVGGKLRGGFNPAGCLNSIHTPATVPAGRRRVSGSAAAGLF